MKRHEYWLNPLESSSILGRQPESYDEFISESNIKDLKGKILESFFICGETAIRPMNFHLGRTPSQPTPTLSYGGRNFSTPIASLTPSRYSRTTQCDSSSSNFDERLCEDAANSQREKLFLKYLLSVLLLKPANLLKYHQEIYSKF